jgi:hypothetical protein
MQENSTEQVASKTVPPKPQLASNGQHGVISQKIVLFTTTAIRTSNPARIYVRCVDIMAQLLVIQYFHTFSKSNIIMGRVERHPTIPYTHAYAIL